MRTRDLERLDAIAEEIDIANEKLQHCIAVAQSEGMDDPALHHSVWIMGACEDARILRDLANDFLTKADRALDG